jgi:hypothetical protein
MNPGCFFIFAIDTGIADMRVSQGDELLAIGRIGQDFLVSGHRGIEYHFAG